MSYYLERKTQYEVSVEALGNQNIFSEELEEAIRHDLDRGQFKVIRQAEREISRSRLTKSKDERYAAITTLVRNVGKYIEEKRGCYFAGYCREFVGLPWETAARRYEPRGKGPVYSIVTSDEHPPIIVGRLLGHKSSDWVESQDTVRKDNIAQKIGLKYSLTDDVTRRKSKVELILPDESLTKAGFSVPQNLQREYAALRHRMRRK